MLYTTLELLQKNNACSSGFATLKASLKDGHSDTKLISLSHILKSNGLEHAIWALRATTVDSRVICSRMAIEFARQVLDNFEKQFPKDKRPRTALEQAEAFLDGKITLKELDAAAESAAWSARSARSAWSAESAWSAAESAAWSAWSAARSAWSAAESAAWSAWSARSAAWSAAEKQQELIFKKLIRSKVK